MDIYDFLENEILKAKPISEILESYNARKEEFREFLEDPELWKMENIKDALTTTIRIAIKHRKKKGFQFINQLPKQNVEIWRGEVGL